MNTKDELTYPPLAGHLYVLKRGNARLQRAMKIIGEWPRDKDGLIPQRMVREVLKAAGMSDHTIWRALFRLNARTYKRMNGSRTVFYWALPIRAEPVD